MKPTVSLDELEQALSWTSDVTFDHAAHVCRQTGRVVMVGAEGPLDDDAPPDLDDESRFVAVPDRRELDLGQRLVHGFVAGQAGFLEAEVRSLFRQRGAYGRFKRLLQDHGLLDRWHAHERQATASALAAWAQDNGFVVAAPRRAG